MSPAEELIAAQPDAVALRPDVNQSIPECFEQRVRLHPRQDALGGSAWKATFEELNDTANRLAATVLGYGVPGDRVALLMGHDAPLIAAVLAVLKAGRIVVVLNPSDPPERHEQVLADAEPSLLLTDPSHQTAAELLTGQALPVRCWDIASPGQSSRSPEVPIAPDDVALLLYTSGSTGRPKGVPRTHRMLLHHVFRQQPGMGVQVSDRVVLLASISGGHGSSSMWNCLLNGAALYPFPMLDRGVVGLANWMRERRITVYTSSASVFRQFMKTLAPGERLPDVRLVRFGSEPAFAGDFATFRRHFSDNCTLLHTFSSSETGSITQLRLTPRTTVAEGRLPLGRPVGGVEVLLLDEDGREVGPGEIGEIVVRSRFIAPGYWRNDGLTAERFPGPDRDGFRLFRSGDLGRWNADGLLEFAGRRDARVKVHGYRVELSEVEGALGRQPGVSQAVVCAQPRADGELQLVAFVCCEPGRTISAEALRSGLRSLLPGPMIPGPFVFLDEIPLTPNGKIDRDKLLQMSSTATPPPAVAEFTTETEATLAKIWSEAFGTCSVENPLPLVPKLCLGMQVGKLCFPSDRRLPSLRRFGEAELRDPRPQAELGNEVFYRAFGTALVDRNANFFDCGGDSLIAALVAARAHVTWHVQLPLGIFAQHPTLAALAAVIDELRRTAGDDELPPLVRVARDEPLPLSFTQERTWRFCQTAEGLSGYTMSGCHRLRGPLDLDALRDCLSYQIGRHEILRTTFAEADGRVVQIVHAPEPIPAPLVDVSGEADPEASAKQIFQREIRQPFDLTRLPLLRFAVVRLRGDEHWLLRVSHHILSDSWSWGMFYRELALLYAARIRGDQPPLPECEPLHYADYAAWQRRTLCPEGPAYRNAVAWWKDFLTGNPQPLELPFRRAKPLADIDASAGVIWWGLDPSIAKRLEQVSRDTAATFFTIRLAAFAALLADETAKPDVVIGTYVTNRTHAAVQNIFGFFANLATLRFRVNPALTFRAWLSDVRDAIGEVQARAAIPYEQLCEELRQQGTIPPEIRAIFSVSDHHAPLRFGPVEATWMERRSATMPWGFSLAFDFHNEASRCYTLFDARIYDPAGVRRLIDRLVRFLDSASSNPDLPLRRLLAQTESLGRRMRRWLFGPLR